MKKTLWKWKEAARERMALEWSARFGRAPQPDRWVFIVGCTNSGTTLLHDLLAQHPDTGALPEDGHFLQTQLATPWGHGLERVWATRPDIFRMTAESDGAGRARRLKRQWARQYDDAGRRVLLEKSPPNALRMPWLERHFDNAHFIGIVRHPFAVVEGIHRKSGWPVALAARQWRMGNEIMLADGERVRRWLWVRYEDVTERTEETIAEIASFIGLEADGIDTERTWRSIGGWGRGVANRNARSFERLSADDRRAVSAEAGPLMERFGYAAPVDA